MKRYGIIVTLIFLFIGTACKQGVEYVYHDVPKEVFLPPGSFTQGYAAGDILLSDGTKIDADKIDTYTIGEAQPIAVVAFQRGEKRIAIGLRYIRVPWANSGTLACKSSIEALRGTVFGGADDGSKALQALMDLYKASDATLTDEQALTKVLEDCPAFYCAEKYGSLVDPRLSYLAGGMYERGWYIPTLCELGKICMNIQAIDASFEKLKTLMSDVYPFDFPGCSFSATPFFSTNSSVCALTFPGGEIFNNVKNFALCFVVLRAF